MKEIYSALIGVLIGSIITVSAQYFISYRMIEKPRIDLEQRKVLLEAQRQLSSFMPNVNTECTAIKASKYTHKFFCRYKNNGQHLAMVTIEDIAINLRSSGIKFIRDKDYKVLYRPKNKNKFLSFPGSKSFIEFDISLKNTSIPDGYMTSYLSVEVGSNFQSSDAELNLLIENFPELKTIAQNLGRQYSYFVLEGEDLTDSTDANEGNQ